MIDIQSKNDNRNIHIDWVGIKNFKRPFHFDIANKRIYTIADIDLFIALDSDKRAIHMSRLTEILANKEFTNLYIAIQETLTDVKQTNDSESVYCEIRFPYFIDKISPVSKNKGVLGYNCKLMAKCQQQDFSLTLEIAVPISSVCPCSKAISDYGAHNQRGILTILVECDQYIDFDSIIKAGEASSSSEIYSILKRTDEKFITEHAYEKAKFVEDIARDTVIILQKNDISKWLKVDIENYESIHTHNAYACIRNYNQA